MATVYFYEKPGCSNNTRQKKLLAAAGHQVVAMNLLTHIWQKGRLRSFFGELAVADWFNYSAPAIKNGELLPDTLTEDEALALMLDNPLLIRRPLMQVGESMMAGFDPATVDNWIGLTAAAGLGDLENCPRQSAQTVCGHD